jgi:3-hydroxymyristoyl/3-hydroxydecanoyl-(acyl carrier protein) dehydratase/malonyl CoA-acyl carrier protein transacylase
LQSGLATAESCIGREATAPIDGRNGVFYDPNPLRREGELAFVFPGSGNHYPGMGRRIAAHWPAVAERCASRTGFFASQFDWQSRSAEDEGIAGRPPEIQSLIFAQLSFGVLVSELLASVGVRPQRVIGYSLGESVGLFATRAWPDRDEMYRRMLASPLFHTQLAGPRTALASSWKLKAGEAAQYTAAVVARSASAVREAIADLNRVRLLIVNTPEECVIGGMAEDVGRAAQGLGCRAIRVEGVPAVHFDAARSVEDAYRDLHLFDTAPPEGVRFYSAAAAEAYDVSRQSAAESITAQAMSGFDFPALIRRAYDDGVRLFVEIGPQASCSRMIGRILEGRPHFARSASVRGVGEVRGVMDLAAALVAQRVDVDLGALLGPAEEKADPCDAPPTRAFISVAIGGPAPRPPLPPGWRSDDPAEVRHGSVDGGSQLAGTGGEVRRLATNAAPSRFDDSRVVFDFGPTARAHERFIEFCQTASEGLASVAALPARLVSAALATDPECLVEPRPLEPDRDLPSRSRTLVETPPGLKPGAGLRSPSGDSHMDGDASACGSAAAEGDIAFNKATCLEFARGQVAKVLGPRFAVVDTYPTRVRLPDEPLMLVDRIIRIEGEVASLSRGRVITEHDVVHDAWYLDGGRAPICIAVEAGQADLFLSGYLGIDLVTRGLRTYRLLDATVTFHRGLPRAGETIRYDIRIDRFVRQGETYLFFFQFDGTIDGEPVLSMRNGCAGFFTEAETRRSHGIVSGSDGDEANIGEAGACFRWPVAAREPGLFRDGANIVESYGDERLAALRNGDLAGCFGAAFAGLPVADPLRLPDGRMKLIDRVLRLAPTGGRRRLGEIVAEADVQPDDWYLLCHFVDDMVMPGTLMYECCAHALRFLLMRLGWMAGRDGARFEPLPGVASSLKCRGPVTPETKKVTYRVTIKEAGYAPHPYVIADALMSADGAAIVQMSNMSLQLSGADRRGVESIWAVAAPRNESIRPAPVSSDRPGAFTREQILAFAIGKPSDCFGPAYAVFDDGRRRVARLPGPPYQFLDRVTKLDPEPLMLAAGGWIEAEYDVSPDAWYFRANRQAAMPFAVLLEIALQPCGFLAAYCGSCLSSEADLSFRNLGGTGTVHREVMPDSGTVQTRVRMTEVAKAGGMIIEHFDFQVRRGGERVYDGSTAFGFFSREALGRQVGIRDGAARRYRLSDAERRAAAAFDLEDQPPLTPADENGGVVASAALPGRAMRMIDRIEALLLEGGPHGLGFVRGSTDVDPAAWFFAAHFYQDPVWPGSLGLESFLQLLKVYALHRYPRLAGTHRFEPIAVGRTHTWAYRGQIVPANRRVAVQAGITACEDGDRPLILASGLLTVDDTTIYEMKDFGMRLAPIRD